SIQAKACLKLSRSFCKQNVYSLVVQFSKIKLDNFLAFSSPFSLSGDFYNIPYFVCFSQAFFEILFSSSYRTQSFRQKHLTKQAKQRDIMYHINIEGVNYPNKEIFKPNNKPTPGNPRMLTVPIVAGFSGM
ncbi:hypothetical protein, partial [Paenibacillus taichungensis]